MKIKTLYLIPILFFTAIISQVANADTHLNACVCKNNPTPWGILYYHSWMTGNNLGHVLFEPEDIEYEYGTMDTVELSYELSPKNALRHYVRSFITTIQVAGNITRHIDPNGIIYEFDPYLIARWEHFPWDKYCVSTFAAGEGVSYATGIPLREKRDSSTKNAKRFLNFLMLEATFALPKYPDVQLVVRIHHRCGAWGLYDAGNLSSNAIGAGIRYLF